MPSQSEKKSPEGDNISPDVKDVRTPSPDALHDHRRKTDCSTGSGIEDNSEDILAVVPGVEVDLENGEGTELKRKPYNIIPRKKRRGLFAQLVIGIPEIDDPIQYSPKTKNFIVFIIAIAAITATMGYYLLVVLLMIDLRYIYRLYHMLLLV